MLCKAEDNCRISVGDSIYLQHDAWPIVVLLSKEKEKKKEINATVLLKCGFLQPLHYSIPIFPTSTAAWITSSFSVKAQINEEY